MRVLISALFALAAASSASAQTAPPDTIVLQPTSGEVVFKVGVPEIDPRIDRVCVYAEPDLETPIVCGTSTRAPGPNDFGVAIVYEVPATLALGTDQFFRVRSHALVDGAEIRSEPSPNRGLMPRPVQTPFVL